MVLRKKVCRQVNCILEFFFFFNHIHSNQLDNSFLFSRFFNKTGFSSSFQFGSTHIFNNWIERHFWIAIKVWLFVSQEQKRCLHDNFTVLFSFNALEMFVAATWKKNVYTHVNLKDNKVKLNQVRSCEWAKRSSQYQANNWFLNFLTKCHQNWHLAKAVYVSGSWCKTDDMQS